jgi:hypothetical protein
MARCLHRIKLELQTLNLYKMKNTKNENQCAIHDVSDSRFSKEEVILLMEWARDKGERDGEILWDEWLDTTFIKFSKIRHNIK